jgi:hypothetical protein
MCYFINYKALLLGKYSVRTLTSIQCIWFISVFMYKNVWSLRSQIQTKKTCFHFCLVILYIFIASIFVRSVIFSRECILLAVLLFLKSKWASVLCYLFLSQCRASILLKRRISTLFTKFSCLFTRVTLCFHKNWHRSIFVLWRYLCVCTSIIVIAVIAVKTTCIFQGVCYA